MDGQYENTKHTYIYNSIPKWDTVAEWRYELPLHVLKKLQNMPDPFKGEAYREGTFLQAYSRSTTRPAKPKARILPVRHHTVSPTWMNNSILQTPMRDRPTRRETWTDVVIRVIEGLMSHHVSHLKKEKIPYSVSDLDSFAENMAYSFHRMEWTPPGRGLFAMGTDYTFKNGNSALNNCYAASTAPDFIKAVVWLMDMLMVGGGVGFDCDWKGEVRIPDKTDTVDIETDDTRQGWVASLEVLMRAYIPIDGEITNKFPKFSFDKVRPYGARIYGFGGTASGPQPLIELLNRVEIWLDSFCEYQTLVNEGKDGVPEHDVKFWKGVAHRLRGKDLLKDWNRVSLTDDEFEDLLDKLETIHSNKKIAYDHTRLIADVINSVGTCVLAGNVRRSAQIALGDPEDETFLNLKNWEDQLLRKDIMGLSNNTVRFWTNEQFDKYLPKVVEQAVKNGEPGVANFINISKYGRIGDTTYGPDAATLLNPCAEISLESFEPCCLATVNPINCMIDGKLDMDRVRRACMYATFYATNVTTIAHHWKETNDVIEKNRRIGISFNGIADLLGELKNIGDLITVSRDMYQTIRSYNTDLCEKLKINRSIRVTTVKPEGTLSIITGTSPGVHFPIINQGKRRTCFDNNSEVLKVLIAANYPTEKSTLADNQTYVIYPIKSHSKRSARKVNIHEKMLLAQVIQRHYADNSVSFTGDFDIETEQEEMQDAIEMSITNTKVISVLPQLNSTTDQYKHLPFEETSVEEYKSILKQIMAVNWSGIYGSIDAEDITAEAVSGCTGDACTFKPFSQKNKNGGLSKLLDAEAGSSRTTMA